MLVHGILADAIIGSGVEVHGSGNTGPITQVTAGSLLALVAL